VGSKGSIIADPEAALRKARQLLASDPAAAAGLARQLLVDRPGDPALLRLAAAGLRRLGDDNEAAKLEKLAVQASLRSPMHRQAARALAAGAGQEAMPILEALIAEDDSDVVALVMLGQQLSKDARYDQAEPLLRRAVDAAPSDLPARLALAEHLHRARRPAEALDQLDRLTPQSETAASRSLRAHVLRDLGRQAEEAAILEELAASADRPEGLRLRLGHAYRTLGRTEEAIAAYRAVLAARPHEGAAWWSLANLKTAAFSDDDILIMQDAAGRTDTPASNRCQLHFALGKAFEDRGEAERAFHHYEQGNRLRQQSTDYRPETIGQWVERSIALLTPAFFADRQGGGCQSPDPIFILGMQRSGSTLVEQILDSHPKVEGTAELRDLPAVIGEQGAAAERQGISFGGHLSRLSGDQLREMGEEYLRRTRIHRKTGKPFFVDKLPTNWMYAGIIRLVLPRAKIIDVRRHPLGCGFSNWKQHYGKGLEHSYAMESMARYYVDYVKLMRHLDAVQPGAIHRVVYERLVEDVEDEVRRLLGYLGLPFSKQCLNFHSNRRSVRTISAGQVRQPINRRGADQWKQYEQWLGPMKQALGPVLEDWQE
jgi:tetratricopeptide (TPR) repeat protein